MTNDRFDPVDIGSIALSQSEPPTGTAFVNEDGNTAITQPVQDSSSEVQRAMREGAIATIFRLFFTPDMLEALNSGPAAMDDYSSSFDSAGHWSVGSWVTAYEHPDAAERALKIILEEFSTTWQLTRLDDPGLGDEGAVFTGNPPQAAGVPTSIYFWRASRYLLQVVAHGSVEPGADEIHAIALGMQSRVPLPLP